ncbi:MAG: hypothetical protein JWQ69_5916 [Pseudomonas sp.]|nr:hypothetical protein [Pseudomonas sp.]
METVSALAWGASAQRRYLFSLSPNDAPGLDLVYVGLESIRILVQTIHQVQHSDHVHVFDPLGELADFTCRTFKIGSDIIQVAL